MSVKFLRTVLFAAFILLTILSCEKESGSEPEPASLKLISPEQDAEWNAGSPCLIKWENTTGEPVKIDMYQDTSFVLNIGTFAHMMSEYLYTVPDSLAPGASYLLRLYAVEKPEYFVKSDTFSILERINILPICTIIDPRDGKFVNSGDVVNVTVSADDEDGEINSVKFYIDGIYAGEMPKASFVFPWSTLGATIGLHSITAVAVDDDGAESLISKVNVVISDGTEPVEIVKIPAGYFSMGSSAGDYDEKPVNKVFITRDYFMGKFEITNSQYAEMLNYALVQNELSGDYVNNKTVTNLNGSRKELLDLDDSECEVSFNGTEFYAETGKGLRPVIELTWWGAAFYCNMLSRQLNVEEIYDMTAWTSDLTKTGYRLPTEAEWEYAAKFNDLRIYTWGSQPPDPSLCNYGLSVGRTTDVGSYSPQGDSKLGLCDMAGNAWEWCNDWYAYYSITQAFLVDPSGPLEGSIKILRGGNINSSAYNLRVSYRNCYSMGSGYFYGMRVVLSIR